MSASATARSRARVELTKEIKDAARRQLAAEGAERLSLRGVARELELVPSALYRYFPSRDDLLTALIVDAYVALADAVDAAVEPLATADLLGRWRVACLAMRAWAVAHPHEFALVYGSPVTGYRAPAATIEPATRVWALLLRLVRDGQRAGTLRPRTGPDLAPALRADLDRLAGALDLSGVPAPVLARAVTAWTHLVGAVSLQLFGHLEGAFSDDAAFFAHSVDTMADLVGFDVRSADHDDDAGPTRT